MPSPPAAVISLHPPLCCDALQRPTHRTSRLAAHVVPAWGWRRKSRRHLWADRKLIDVAHSCSNILLWNKRIWKGLAWKRVMVFDISNIKFDICLLVSSDILVLIWKNKGADLCLYLVCCVYVCWFDHNCAHFRFLSTETLFSQI